MNIKKLIKKVKKIYAFVDDDTLLYSSAMSYSTIFAIIPLLMLVIYIIDLTPYFSDYSDVFKKYVTSVIVADSLKTQILNYINIFLNNIHKLGLIGSLYAIFVTSLFISTYEQIMSKIFHYKQPPFHIYIKKYILLIIFIPFLTIFLIIVKIDISHIFKLNSILASVVTFIISWVIAFIFYITSAYKHITVRSIFLASLLFTLIMATVKFFFVYYVTINFTYTEIYSSFSILLFFIFSIYLYWMIYFYGLKISILIERKSKIKKINKNLKKIQNDKDNITKSEDPIEELVAIDNVDENDGNKSSDK